MSKAKQCPSTVGKKPVDTARAERDVNHATGRQLWRSLDDLVGTSEFRDFLHREFPAYASELTDPSRRSFLRVMGASLALAGAATLPGCRRPEHKILPYGKQPEDVIPGKALYYATAMPLPGGGAEGLLVETHEGRPTKLEGNPLHPVNQGRSSAWAQASVLNLYDPDRPKSPSRMGEEERVESTWSEFEDFAGPHFAQFDQLQGAGLVFLVGKKTSPSRDRLRDQIVQRWPQARWLPYEAVDNESAREGAAIAYGSPMESLYDFSKAKVIVSIDRDFLAGEGATLPEARGFAAGRRVMNTHGDESEMSRIYSIESTMSLVGGAADHRLRLRPTEIPAYMVALSKAVIDRVGGADYGPVTRAVNARNDDAALAGLDREWIDAVADDLLAHRGEAVVTVGPSQPAAVHAMAHAINQVLGAVGSVVTLAPVQDDVAASSVESIRTLAQLINSGRIDTLVVMDANPVFDAPADLGLHQLWSRIPTTISMSVDDNETGAMSTWHLNGAHYLESWGDVRAADGTLSVVQPMIAPFFGGRSDLEVLALMLNADKRDGYEIVRETWRTAAPGMQSLSDSMFEKRWNRALHNGLLEGTGGVSARPSLNADGIMQAIQSMPAVGAAQGIDLVFHADRSLFDGRWANNGWLQELPDPLSKVTWDNPALISADTARELGVIDGDIVEISNGQRSMEIPVFRQPGMANNTIALALGGGRERSGRIGTGVGFNTYLVRTSNTMRVAPGASVTKTGSRHPMASVQNHWAMEGRALARDFDVQAWREHGDSVIHKEDAYGNEKTLEFAERVGVLSHAPVNKDIYKPAQEHHYTTSPQWGMSIDLTTCSGCGACTVACQAENNIPVVGKYEVIKGREMHWIRVDRYYVSDNPADPDHFDLNFGDAGPYTGGRSSDEVDMIVQPVACVHCEAAPCETVCPVNATVHGPEGTNNMAYNRCIGTRYCANNCPYKVRRFNFFDYATKRLNGDYVGKDLLGGVVKNEQLIPPRLREKIDEGDGVAQTMQFNPHVTVRERGVMEKCTYCIQRVNEARVDSKLRGLDSIPDGFMQTACEQACPTESIVFGDIEDPLSKVRQLRDNARSYLLLGYLNTRPRTTYMARLRNPNPRLRDPILDPFEHHGDSHGGDDHGGDDHGASDTQSEGHVMSLPILTMQGGLA